MSEHSMYRPPAEADSVLLRVADGCPHNRCHFCAMYRGVPYRVEHPETVRSRIHRAARQTPAARRVFLADGDVLALPPDRLHTILTELRLSFPGLSRVSCYASGLALANRSDADLRALREASLHTLYLGLESGSDDILQSMGKGAGVREMIDGCCRAQAAGLCVSVMALIGLGGQSASAEHVRLTADALNRMQPRLLSCLRLVPIAGTPLATRITKGMFTPLTEAQAVRELRDLISRLELQRTVFRADHSSNILPLSGRLPRDRERLLEELDELLDCNVLDTRGPGAVPSVL